MTENIQKQVDYFTTLKFSLIKKIKKKNLKSFLLFLIMTNVVFLSLFWFALSPNTETQEKFLLLKFISGMLFVFSLFFYFAISSSVRAYVCDDKSLSNKEDINLYDALFFIYKENIDGMSEQEKLDYIEVRYERAKLKDLMLATSNKKSDYDKLKMDIEQIYQERSKLVSEKHVLNEEYKWK